MAWARYGMASVDQTRLRCVNQIGKTHSIPLAARHGRETAWVWHGHAVLCESAFTVSYFVYSLDQCQLSCNTTYHQYVYAVDSEFLSIEQMVPAELPYITAACRLYGNLPKKRFHTGCLPGTPTTRAWHGTTTQKFHIETGAIYHKRRWCCAEWVGGHMT